MSQRFIYAYWAFKVKVRFIMGHRLQGAICPLLADPNAELSSI